MLKNRFKNYFTVLNVFIFIQLILYISCNTIETNTDSKAEDESIDISILPEKSIIQCLQLMDSSNAWLIAALPSGKSVPKSGIYKSSDGGKSWLLNYSSQFKKLYTFHFANPLLGWVVGDSGLILKTTDGGNTWSNYLVDHRKDTAFHKISFGYMQFVSQMTGWIYGAGKGLQYKYVYHTTDAGESWMRVYKTTQPIAPFFMMKDKKGFLSTYNSMDNFGESEIYFSEDNFQSPLVRRYMPDDPGMVQHIEFVNDKHGIIFGYRFFFTSDGGVRWKVLDTPFSKVIEVALVNSKKIFVSDADSYHHIPLSIFQSTDEGVTWTKELTDITSAYHFAFANDSTGILYGTYAKPLYRYRSGVWSLIN